MVAQLFAIWHVYSLSTVDTQSCMKSSNGHSLKRTFSLYIFIRHTVEKTNKFFLKNEGEKSQGDQFYMKRKVACLKSSDVTNEKNAPLSTWCKADIFIRFSFEHQFLVNYYFSCGHFSRLSHTVCTADMAQSLLYGWSCLSSQLTWLSILISILHKIVHLLLKIVWLVFSENQLTSQHLTFSLAVSYSIIFEGCIISILNYFFL